MKNIELKDFAPYRPYTGELPKNLTRKDIKIREIITALQGLGTFLLMSTCFYMALCAIEIQGR